MAWKSSYATALEIYWKYNVSETLYPVNVIVSHHNKHWNIAKI